MPIPIVIPLLNPNEPEALIVSLLINESQFVKKDEVLATFETTKSASELYAEKEGYIVGLRLSQGEVGRAGEILCYLAETPDWVPPAVKPDQPKDQASPPKSPAGLRITKPAERLARELGLDLDQLPIDRLLTERMVQELFQSQASKGPSVIANDDYDHSAIVVYGGGGHGKALVDLLRSLGSYRIVGIIDDGISAGKDVLGLPVLGGSEFLAELFGRGVRQAVNAVGGIGDITIRVQVFKKLSSAGFICPSVVHPSAVVEPSATIDAGVQIFAQSYVGSESKVGYGCIINTGAIVSHDCVLEDYANISPGAILAGEVFVGSQSLIGMGATLNLRVRVGSNARIGNGATIKQDVPEKGFVRAGSIWP